MKRTAKAFASRLPDRHGGKAELKIKNYETRNERQSLPTAAGPPSLILLMTSRYVVQPAVLMPMSRLDSHSSQNAHPRGSTHLCRALPSGSIASPFH
jgi:hypothetical protein